MTLVVAVPAQDGVVIASDSQATIGIVRTAGNSKIFQLGHNIIWGFAGSFPVMQKVQENLSTILADPGLITHSDLLEQSVQNGFRHLWGSDIRALVANPDIAALILDHDTHFFFVEANPQPLILQINGSGNRMWHRNAPAAIGSGNLFAIASFGKYGQQQFTLDQAKLIAYKTIYEAITVAAFGLNHPIDVWSTQNGQCHRLDQNELRDLADADRTIRQSEIKLITDYAPAA